MITRTVREALIAHMDGHAVPYIVISHDDGMAASQAAAKATTIRALIARGWLRPDRCIKPKHTYITELGRAELTRLLAEYADVLTRAGCAEGIIKGRLPVMPRFQGPLPPAPQEPEIASISGEL